MESVTAEPISMMARRLVVGQTGQCQIDSIPQSWSVLSVLETASVRALGMEAVVQRLVAATS